MRYELFPIPRSCIFDACKGLQSSYVSAPPPVPHRAKLILTPLPRRGMGYGALQEVDGVRKGVLMGYYVVAKRFVNKVSGLCNPLHASKMQLRGMGVRNDNSTGSIKRTTLRY